MVASLGVQPSARKGLGSRALLGSGIRKKTPVLALLTDRAYAVVAFARFIHQLADFLGRILQVGVERDNNAAA